MTAPKKPTIVITEEKLTAWLKGKSYVFRKTDPRYETILAKLCDGVTTQDELYAYIDKAAKIKNHISGLFNVTDAGQVTILDTVVPDMLGKRIIQLANDSQPINPLIKLWKNILKNPDPRAQTDLYRFLEVNNHPITPDGCFIAYRSVKKLPDGNLVDFATGEFNNNIGQLVQMKREDCDPNPDQTCSRGLHCASIGYVSTFGSSSDRVIVNVKVNPKDVVSIPTDYHNTKMRCCEFKVIEINKDIKEIESPIHVGDGEKIVSDADAFTDLDPEYEVAVTSVASEVTDDDKEVVKIDPTENWKRQLRDDFGRFVKKS